MDGGLGAFIPGVTIGLTIALGIYRARDEEPWKIALGVAVGFLLAGVLAVLLGWASTDLDRLLIMLGVLGSVAVATGLTILVGIARRRSDPSAAEPPRDPA